MFVMRPKVLDGVFAARVLGVFVPNLATPCQRSPNQLGL